MLRVRFSYNNRSISKGYNRRSRCVAKSRPIPDNGVSDFVHELDRRSIFVCSTILRHPSRLPGVAQVHGQIHTRSDSQGLRVGSSPSPLSAEDAGCSALSRVKTDVGLVTLNRLGVHLLHGSDDDMLYSPSSLELFSSDRRRSLFAWAAADESHLVIGLGDRLQEVGVGAILSNMNVTILFSCYAKSSALFAGAMNRLESLSKFT